MGHCLLRQSPASRGTRDAALNIRFPPNTHTDGNRRVMVNMVDKIQ